MKPLHTFKSASTVHQLYIHFVFVVKYRKKTIDLDTLDLLRRVFTDVCAELECRLISCNSDEDHVHVLVAFPPKIAIAELANRLKGRSSYEIHRRPPKIEGDRQRDDPKPENPPTVRTTHLPFWSPSYFVKTVGFETVSHTFAYIRDQGAGKKQPSPRAPS
jgi:putative transposase